MTSQPLSFAETYAACEEDVVGVVVGCDVVRVTGRDAASYLQTQCSQDLAGLSAGESAESLLLSPQGRVDAYVRVVALGEEELLVVVAAGFGDAVHERLRRFRLRVKAELAQEQWRCVMLRGPRSPEVAALTGRLSLPVTWPGVVGVDLLAPDAELPAGVATGDPGAFESIRIESGEPSMGREITARTIAQEAGLVARTVSFTKGCYPGQELVARIDARGDNVPKRLRGVVVSLVEPLDPGSAAPPVSGSDDAPSEPDLANALGAVLSVDARDVGELTSAAWSPRLGAMVALAYVRRDVVPPARAVLTEDGRAPIDAEIVELPIVAQR